MTAEQWQRIRPILESALELDADSRPAFLDKACVDPSLRRQLESLLGVQKQAEEFMENPVLDAPPPATGGTVSGQRGQPSLFELTTSYDRKTGDFGRLDLRLARGSGSAQSLEIRDLLRRRLQIIVLMSFIGNALFNALRFLRLEFTPTVIRYTMVPGALNVLAMATLAAILWRKRIYTLRQLRWLEVVTFGITTVYFLGETYTPLFLPPAWLVMYAQRHASEMSILVRQPSINWLVIIISYGMFIPNTGRRCAAVTVTIALSPLILLASAGLLHPEIPRRLLALFLTEMSFWLACAVAMAIYGSHKITVLRQEAVAARKLGQYDLKERLGCGGMGEVYLAEHVLLKRPCAVKVIRPDQTDNPSTLQRFLREVQVTATLTHPNTVQIFDYGQTDDGTVFYAMEYLAGLDLEKLVREYGSLPAQRVIYVLRQLCGALAEAHAVGLIHRDIKPSNVILCRRGGLYDVAKLLDFGLVRMQSTDITGTGFTQAGLIFGTPAYMSPEQAAANKELDARSDIYSLGALAWFLSTGEPPFVRDGVVQTLAAHINEPVPALRSLRPDLPEDLDAIVQCCLAKAPYKRFANITSLEQALAQCSLAAAWSQSEAAAWWNAISEAAEFRKVEHA